MTDTSVDEMSFETAMAELEKVLGQLERGDVALEESIALYDVIISWAESLWQKRREYA